MAPQGSVLFTGPYPEPEESNLHPHKPLL